MHRFRKLVLLLSTVAAFSAQARDVTCRDFDLAASAGRPPVVVNHGTSEVTLSLRFRPTTAKAALACRPVSLRGGQSANVASMAAGCSGLASPLDGVLTACVVLRAVSAPHGVATGELGADMVANNLPVAGR